MVRAGAKRERPCMVLLHVALRSAATQAATAAADGQTQHQQRGAGPTSSSAASPERYVWKSRRTAEAYAGAVLRCVRAQWAMVGGVRYDLPDAAHLESATWDGDATLPAAATGGEGAESGKDTARTSRKAEAGRGKKQHLCTRDRRMRVTQRRSGVLRCAVQLSRSLYGDAAALHIFRAACACVTAVDVSLPLSALVSDDNNTAAVAAAAEEEEGRPVRRRRLIEDGDARMEQVCHAAVRVARVEHVVSSRKH
ncbi:hypothetical protein ABB37_06898 [Leptomonas pyrrhocoris]|uniref:Uncharacterized protein n=1 Tax=Leptomonas pyrrhocoris TaxID=157538 RepID=A0A0N0DTI2_LEPPY|nr:hypothetical protein ABB37_06898 [Leptomonas pyrrhocoris]XP_015655953.1 hypothetical protein ABB37_06898 [Leptomonas pyrrhocoris]XP_015655954.1 hypothetical protein ABB37_06898 [Leptomonas pyrrhocoris]KPA77513.1 hypothetical protein ABB37_06898 [Leptomonas pyrrhocoris]KPA77514.1 hypothetical protein ABB37_06898 [Leptomonas pyrrhocoris]KPA77515.1 hypothetical protein ABB37_06898 [Leptomonas pyrrhocoris]|eukprot:XP_015655952.1 hypothetical protein ABB37_06898 [Leptomonas pyrrhocoris]